MRAFVLSVIVVLCLLVSTATFPVSQNDNAVLVRGASASAALQAVGNETIWFDMFGWSRPIAYSLNPLANGTSYIITIEGTWSIWGSGHWESVSDPPVGDYEEAPMYASGPGSGTGRVGSDPFFAFACIYGWDYANGMGFTTLPSPMTAAPISLDNGASWIPNRPMNDTYSPTHKYEVRVTGQGQSIGFRSVDAQADDNYGMLKIVIEPEVTAPSAPRNLTAAAGDASVSLAWEAPSNDGGSPITNYSVYRGPDPGNLTLLAVIGNTTTYIDGGVVNRNTYYYAVSASNSAGEGSMTLAVGCMPDWPEHHPSCAITSPVGEYVTTTDVSMTWTMSDPISGIDFAEVRLDQGSWISKGIATSHTFTGMPDGDHTLILRVYNNAGYNSSASRPITVDTIPPSNVANSWSQTDASGTLRVTFSEAMGSVQGLVDGAPVTFSLLDRNATATVTLTPGTHNLTMTGMDLAGNPVDYYAPFQFTVVEFTVQVSGQVVDGDGDPISGAQVDIDGVQTTTGTDGWFFCSVTPGQHEIEITATGMQDHSEQVTVTEEGGELGDFTMIPTEEPEDGDMDWLYLGIAAIVGVALLLLILLFVLRKKK